MMNELRYAVRTLLKSPGFTTVAVLTLALGIGANTAIFGVVNAFVFHFAPFPQPERIVQISEGSSVTREKRDLVTAGDFIDIQSQTNIFERAAVTQPRDFVDLSGSEPIKFPGANVSADWFAVLGVRPQLGRVFLPEEETPGRDQVMVLSHNLWQRRFGGDPKVIGRTLPFKDRSYTVVGVLPPGAGFPLEAEAWAPCALTPEQRLQRDVFSLRAMARLKPGVSVAQAQGAMDALAHRLAEAFPATNGGRNVDLVPLPERLVGAVRPGLVRLLGAVTFVLLIALVNVASLSLARASSRRKEIALRVALGASRGRIVRQFLTESIVLSLLGGAAGLCLAAWGTRALAALMPGELPRVAELGLGGWVFGYALLSSVATGVAVGLAPALQFAKAPLNEALKAGARTVAGGRSRQRLHRALLATEVALALALLVGSGLLLKSFWVVLRADPGFNPHQVLITNVAASESDDQESRDAAFFKDLIQRLERLPGVGAVGMVNALPLSQVNAITGFEIEGRPAQPGETRWADIRPVFGAYFQALGIPVLRGRSLIAADQTDSPTAAVINQELAGRLWPRGDAIGQRLIVNEKSLEIVGVVANVRHQGLENGSRPEIYVPYLVNPWPGMFLAVRTTGDARPLIGAIHREILASLPTRPVESIVPLEQILAQSLAARRFNALLLGGFAVVALALAGVGIYGVMSYLVSQRTHEIGVRMALGARRVEVLRMVIGQGMALTLAGMAVGLLGSLWLTRILGVLLFAIRPTDPTAFAAAMLALGIVALAACYLPARRATRVDPLVALRNE